jgi:benzoylformate decarboxylase/acetolactate synthase-1/2/3 large subunit
VIVAAPERVPTQPRIEPTVEYGSDRIVTLLSQLGYRFIACNPGASFRGLHDSIANVPGAPRLIMATHEEIAVAIAHGYAKAAGEPMAAAVHDVVGLQHATMAVFNAWCDQASVLIIGGTGPVDAARRRPFIDWVHTALVQGQLVRDYVKWDDQPASLEAALESIVRADRITRAEPPGPVYVCLDVDLQEQPVDTLPPDPTRPAAPTPLHPDPSAIEEAADWLVNADRPFAIADMVGRHPAAMHHLRKLAERVAMPVVDLGGRLNFPSDHPLDATDAISELPAPDLVLLLEVTDPAGALHRLPGGTESPRVITIGTRELGARSWASHYQALAPSDLSITAAAGSALAALSAAVERRPAPALAADRAADLGARAASRRAAWRDLAEQSRTDRPIAIAWLFAQLARALDGRSWSLVNGPIESPWPRRLLDLRDASAFFGGSGGAGIGYAAGASVGAALALRDRGVLPVGVLGDGDLLYTPGAIWTAVHEQIPVLLVVANNRSYFNSEAHALAIAGQRGRPTSNAGLGTRIEDPHVDFSGLARSLGAVGLGPVTDPDELPSVLAAATEQASDGAVVVVDVVTQPR